MSFSEALKETVRRRAHLKCCVCRAFGVEIHHIVPQADGGPDTEENAAPLCPSCHEIYGANPTKRKLIREARDVWFDFCERHAAPALEAALRDIVESLKNVATKDDIARIAMSRGPSADLGSVSAGDQYSFVRPEFVHPLIVRELLGWISDRWETIVAVDLFSANRSNRFFGEFTTREEEGRMMVSWKGDTEAFGYSHFATSPSGIHMIQCSDWGGGSGIFTSMCLLRLEADRSFVEDAKGSSFSKERLLLKTLGHVGLGDRYMGTITYDNGILTVGPDQRALSLGYESKERQIPIA